MGGHFTGSQSIESKANIDSSIDHYIKLCYIFSDIMDVVAACSSRWFL